MTTLPKRDANGKFLAADPNNPKRKKKKAKPAATVTVEPTLAAPAGRMSALSIAAAATKKKPPAPPPAPPPKLKNHIAFIIDRSGSMQGVWEATIKALKDNFNEVRGQSIRTGQETTVTLTGFGDNVEISSLGKPIEDFQLPGNMSPNMGMTALHDAVGQTVERMAAFRDADEKHVSFMVIVLTDGMENASQRFNRTSVERQIKTLQATDRWSFAFLVPPGQESVITNGLGLPGGNVMAWESSTVGAQRAGAAVKSGITRYYGSRSAGKSSTQGFFVTDMSKVTARDLSKLTNLAGQVRILEVEKEVAIAPFVESKMGGYVLGTAYYQISKPEKIQPQKQILIMKKGDKSNIYGGYEARQLLGLPDGVDVKVKPGNHGNFDIYCQSTSVNRVLVRGTKLLVMK